MSHREPRHRISREDAGILLSFATRPDRLTEDLIDKLGEGVTYPELVEIAAWVGLPKSTAMKLAQGDPAAAGSSGPGRAELPVSFRRSLIGVLAMFVGGAAVLNLAWDRSWWSVLSVSLVFGLLAYGVYSLIVRVATN